MEINSKQAHSEAEAQINCSMTAFAGSANRDFDRHKLL